MDAVNVPRHSLRTGCVLAAAPTASAKPKPEAGPTVFVGDLTHEQLKQLTDLGLDRSDISARQGATKGTTSVEVVLQRRQAAKLNGLGLSWTRKGRRRHGVAAAQQQSGKRLYGLPLI